MLDRICLNLVGFTASSVAEGPNHIVGRLEYARPAHWKPAEEVPICVRVTDHFLVSRSSAMVVIIVSASKRRTVCALFLLRK